MDPVSLSTAAATILALVDWKEVGKKLAGDAASDAAKAGRKTLLRRLQPDQRQKAAKDAVALFTEEFLKELDDKTPLASAIPGYHDQLKRLVAPAAPDIASWLQADIKEVDLGPVERMWSGLNLDLLPEDFDWQLVARNFARAIRQHIKKDPELRQQLAIALEEDGPQFRSALRAGIGPRRLQGFSPQKVRHAPIVRDACERL